MIHMTFACGGREKTIVALLLLVVRPGAPSSVLAPSSDALVPSSFLLTFACGGRDIDMPRDSFLAST